MFRLAELFVEISARTGTLDAALTGLHSRLLGMGPLGSRLSGAIHSATNAFLGLGSLGAVALGAIAAGVTAVTFGLAHCAFEVAHLQEAIAKVEQTFGSATPKLLSMADELARRFGVIRKEILDVAASFGLMLQGAGVERELSAGMSVALSRIAVDAASFFDVQMSEAIMRLQSGLSGEMEAVRRWGINLTESNIKNKAGAMGFQDVNNLDQGTKTLIRYKLIMEGLTAAQGDAERSQFRLIGQWKVFTGLLSEQANVWGERFIPVITGGLSVLNSFLGIWVRLEQAINGAGRALIRWSAGLLGNDDIFGEKEAAERQRGIDARIARTEADRKKDEEAAQANEAAGKAGKKHEPKGWSGGLEQWLGRVQEAAWGPAKQAKTQEAQLKEQQAQTKLLQSINAKAGMPRPGDAGLPAWR